MVTKCDKHPKYRGDKKPSNTCEGCLALYIEKMKLKVRHPIKPTKVEVDKRAYNRKRYIREDE